jgi:thiamine biosynthesis lipoprotein
VTKPEGIRLDLGGIGKGFAVDRAAVILATTGNFLIDAGGDIFAAGDGEDGAGWLVAVSGPPPECEDIALLRLKGEALATSTVSVRRWQRGSRWMHHIIDPRTGEPAASDVLSASVIAPTTVEAEVIAKVAVLLGSEEGAAMLGSRSLAGLLQLESGSIVTSKVWDQRMKEDRPHSWKGRVE